MIRTETKTGWMKIKPRTVLWSKTWQTSRTIRQMSNKSVPRLPRPCLRWRSSLIGRVSVLWLLAFLALAFCLASVYFLDGFLASLWAAVSGWAFGLIISR